MAYFRCGGGPIQQAGGSIILANNPTITITRDNPNQVTITWSKPSSEVAIDHYNVYSYKSDTAPMSLKQFTLVTSISDQLTCTIGGLSKKSTYYFVVTSVTEANYENASIKNKKSMYLSEVFALIRGGSKWYFTPDFVNYTAVDTSVLAINALVSYSPYSKNFYSLVPNARYTYKFSVVNNKLSLDNRIANPTVSLQGSTYQTTYIINSAFSYMESSSVFCLYSTLEGTAICSLDRDLTWHDVGSISGIPDILITVMGAPTGFSRSEEYSYMYSVKQVCGTFNGTGYVAVGRESDKTPKLYIDRVYPTSLSTNNTFGSSSINDCLGVSSNISGNAIMAIGKDWIVFLDGSTCVDTAAAPIRYKKIDKTLASNIIYSEAGNCFFAMGTDYVYKIPASTNALDTTTWETYELPSDIKSSYSSSKTPAIVTT